MEHQGGNVQGDSNITDGQWHHVAVTVQASSTISYPDVILYVDGLDDTRPTTDPDAFNLIAGEDVRIGRRGLQVELSRLTSRFDMREGGVDYGEQADSWLDPDTSGRWPKP